MSISEIQRWKAFFSIQGLDIDRIEFQLAQIAALIYNSNRGKQKSLSIKDFIPKIEVNYQSRPADSTEVLIDKVNILRTIYRKNK